MVIRAAGEQTDLLDGALEAILNGFAAFGRQRHSDVLGRSISSRSIIGVVTSVPSRA